LQQKPGIYVIYNKTTKKAYIGHTSNIRHRIRDHQWHLGKHEHANGNLNEAFVKEGLNNFDWMVFIHEELNLQNTRLGVETYIIRNWPYGVYNIKKAG
jgi:group I intron endonuclease